MNTRLCLLAVCAAVVVLAASPAGAQCASDINGDSNTDVADLLSVLGNWGPCADPMNCPQDITGGDDDVGVPDLLALLGSWGPCIVISTDHLRFLNAGMTATCWDEADSRCTNATRAFPNEANSGGTAYGIAGARLHLEVETQIMEFNVVGGQALPFWSDPNHKVRINVHSTAQEFADAPMTGDVMSIELDNAMDDTLVTSPPDVFVGSTSIYGYSHHYLQFDFMPFTLPAGDYIISFVPLSSGNFNYAETLTDLGSDVWTDNSMVGGFVELDAALRATTGTVAADVKGVAVP